MTTPGPLTSRLAEEFARLPQVEAVAIGGSRARDQAAADGLSDLDLYVFTRGDIPLPERRALVDRAGGASRAELGQRFWGESDLWIAAGGAVTVDVNYFDAGWMQDAIARVVDRHQASMGYTTCFWHTIRQAAVLFDRRSWLAQLKARAGVPYPEPLRRNIIALNHPVLRSILTSYAAQIDKAVARRDAVSINHRVAALLASYFDCLFAANRVTHPGEKRLVELAVASCRFCPAGLDADIEALLRATAAEPAAIADRLTVLLDKLDAALIEAGIDGIR